MRGTSDPKRAPCSPSPARERGPGGEVLLVLLLAACAGRPAATTTPTPTDPLERCHQAYLTAGSDGPKLLAVDSMIVDSTTTPPLRCGPLRSAHPRLKSSE